MSHRICEPGLTESVSRVYFIKKLKWLEKANFTHHKTTKGKSSNSPPPSARPPSCTARSRPDQAAEREGDGEVEHGPGGEPVGEEGRRRSAQHKTASNADALAGAAPAGVCRQQKEPSWTYRPTYQQTTRCCCNQQPKRSGDSSRSHSQGCLCPRPRTVQSGDQVARARLAPLRSHQIGERGASNWLAPVFIFVFNLFGLCPEARAGPADAPST